MAKAQQTPAYVQNVLAGHAEIEGNPQLRARIQEVCEALRPIGSIHGIERGGRPEEDGSVSHRRYRILGNSGSRLCLVQITNEGNIAWIELLP